jgi:hypothetical protein
MTGGTPISGNHHFKQSRLPVNWNLGWVWKNGAHSIFGMVLNIMFGTHKHHSPQSSQYKEPRNTSFSDTPQSGTIATGRIQYPRGLNGTLSAHSAGHWCLSFLAD